MNRTAWFLLAILLASSAFARLGKTVEECDTLYKASLLNKARTQNGILIKNYGTEKVAISCRFYNNICFEIGVCQLDSNGKVQSLTPEQVTALVRTNLGSIPKIDPNEKNVGPNTVEHKFCTDGRYVMRDENTATGIITILRDNTLFPDAKSAPTSSFSADWTTSLIKANGAYWKSETISSETKIAYLRGLMAGLYGQKTYKQIFEKLSFADLIIQINDFYTDPRNLTIPISTSVSYLSDKLSGKTQSVLADDLIALRLMFSPAP